MEAIRTHSVGRTLGSWTWKLALVLALVYGALQVLVRTDVFRAHVPRHGAVFVRVGHPM